MAKSRTHGGSKYSFRNPPASAIEPKFAQKDLKGMKRAPNSPSTMKKGSSSNKKH